MLFLYNIYMNFFNNNKEKLSEYDSDEGLSYKQLRFSEWYLRHKADLKKWFIRFLMSVCVITVGGSFIGWIYYYSFGYWNDQDLVANEVSLVQNYSNIQNFYKAQQPDISSVKILQNGTDKYDVFANVQNANEYWLLELKYKFVYSGGETNTSTAVILPLEQRAISTLGIEGSAITNGAELRVESLDWDRIGPSPTKFRSVKNYKANKLAFSVSDFNFNSANLDEGIPARVNFTIKNDTAYSYWEPEFFIRLYDQDNLIRIRKVKINKFLSGTERDISLSFTDPNINITKIEYKPIINIFSEDEHMNPPS